MTNPEDQVKSAFSKVKQDILNIQSQLFELKQEIKELKELKRTLDTSTHLSDRQTDRQQISDTSTHIHHSQSLKVPNSNSSIGNGGVSTDRQTDRQTDNIPQKFVQIYSNPPQETHESFIKNTRDTQEIAQELNQKQKQETDMSIVLNSINTLRSSLSENFKSLTKQEFLIFSTLYIQEKQGNTVTYQSIASKLSLTESSIRDYILRIIKKGIPVDKRKINNKKIILSIPQDFKRLASLDTITEIREASKS